MSGGGGKPPAAPDYVGVAREQGRQNADALRIGAALNRVNQSGPTGSTTYSQDPNNPDSWTQETSLSGNQQNIFDQGEQNQMDLGRIANSRLGDVGQQGQFNLEGLPDRVNGVQTSNFQGEVGLPGAEQRTRAEDAIYRSATRQLDPQFQQREDSTRTRLMNQGVTEGSEAWNNDMAQLERDRTSAYGDARDRSINAGGAEASRMLADDLARTGFSNDTESQRYGQLLQNAQMQNEGRQVATDERLLERQLPMNEFLQLYGGGGGGAPLGAPDVASVGSPAAGDFQGASDAQYGAQTDMYNWRQGRNAQNTQTGLQLAQLAASIWG